MELLNQILEAQAFIDKSTDGIKDRFKGSMLMAQNQSKDALKKLKSEYAKFLTESVVLMLPTGSSTGISKLATHLKGRALVIDGNKLYSDLAKSSDASMSEKTRMFSTLQQQHLISSMYLEAEKLGVRSLPQPQFKEILHFATFDDTVRAVKGMVRASNGDDLNKLFIEKAILDSALAEKVSKSPVYVLLTGLNEEEKKNLPKLIYSGNHLVVEEIPAEVDQEYTDKLIKTLNKKYKKVEKVNSTP